MEAKRWTEEEEILALALYFRIPFSKITGKNQDIIQLANLLNRSPNSVGMKMCNFARFDPYLKARGISGLQNGAALDEKIWNRYANDPVRLYSEAEEVAAKYSLKVEELLSIPTTETAVTRNNRYFRYAVLSAYDNTCCISGLDVPSLLHAVYINPTITINPDEKKIDPSNGLCLNSLHREAFEKGIITIDDAYKIAVSKRAKSEFTSEAFQFYFKQYEGKQISLPRQFLPDKEMLRYHNEKIFIA